MYWNSFSVIYELKNEEDKFKILKKRKNSSKWKEIQMNFLQEQIIYLD